jgi:hypothetical protein
VESSRSLAPILTLAWFAIPLMVGMALGRVIHAVILLVLAGSSPMRSRRWLSLRVRYVPFLPRAVAIAHLIGFLIVASMPGVVRYTAITQITQLVDHLPGDINEGQRFQPKALAVLRPLGIGALQRAAVARLLDR